ncbi:HupE/UreJ family protein [Aquimarina sp. ERC-38]|uniref:HupE/UreJ family protein n=1 Tax=Aquimarina sp. ERC-38 TaxID=2949996 RepID=UPI0022483A14|nr:HupE/UreJ family protein [Aquimarina sp. ERC-38]UZO82196.1 HupE/UreJ family protein [Aquimarina sp. ERC-38]
MNTLKFVSFCIYGIYCILAETSKAHLMSEFWLYVQLGFYHVLDWKAYDHILFLTVLAVSFSADHWKKVLWAVTAFTLGHTIALFLSIYKVVSINKNMIEFLIPVTILITAIFVVVRSGSLKQQALSPVFIGITIFFGLIHGFGFSNYFKVISSNTGAKLIPGLSFATGIELSQLLLVVVVLLVGFLVQQFFKVAERDWVLVIASVVIGMTIPMVQNNWIF